MPNLEATTLRVSSRMLEVFVIIPRVHMDKGRF